MPTVIVPKPGVFFIGDLHLGHKNIMQFGQRNYSCIEEHDDAMVHMWNLVVPSKRALVWVLGDVAMTVSSLDKLKYMNGKKKLIMGNHDKFDTGVYLKYFESVHGVVGKYHNLVMSHVPIHPNELQYRKWRYNVHGHIHDMKKQPEGDQYINVNADNTGLMPVHLDEIRCIIKHREFVKQTVIV